MNRWKLAKANKSTQSGLFVSRLICGNPAVEKVFYYIITIELAYMYLNFTLIWYLFQRKIHFYIKKEILILLTSPDLLQWEYVFIALIIFIDCNKINDIYWQHASFDLLLMTPEQPSPFTALSQTQNPPYSLNIVCNKSIYAHVTIFHQSNTLHFCIFRIDFVITVGIVKRMCLSFHVSSSSSNIFLYCASCSCFICLSFISQRILQ